MGWTDTHLHCFTLDGDQYSIPSPSGDDVINVIDSTDVWMSDVIRGKGAKFDYMYDFGDGWDHTIKVEAVEQAEPAVTYPAESPARETALLKTAAESGVTKNCSKFWSIRNTLSTKIALTGAARSTPKNSTLTVPPGTCGVGSQPLKNRADRHREISDASRQTITAASTSMTISLMKMVASTKTDSRRGASTCRANS